MLGCGGGGVVDLREDEVNDGEYAGKSFGEAMVGRHLERDAGFSDLAFRAYQPLRQRRLAHQESAGDLASCQADHDLQREGHPGRHRERWMAAGENQAQPVVPQADQRVLADPGHRLSRVNGGHFLFFAAFDGSALPVETAVSADR